jgi:hypothetical protein
LSKLKRKSGVETLTTGSTREGSKATTCEHLQNLPKSGRIKKLRRKSDSSRHIGYRKRSGPSNQGPRQRRNA